MLRNLFIKNIALISSQNIEFENGLCVLSGETGAGKSIIVDALSFVLGERADKNLIKYGEETAFVEAAFELEPDSRALAVLEEMGFERDTALILSRSLNRNGKNESRINGRLCAAGMLLLEKKKKLLNFEKISSAVGGALVALDGENGVLERIAEAVQCFAGISSLGDDFAAVSDRLDALRYEAEDIVSTIEDMSSDDEFDETLDSIEERLDRIKSLKKKYGATFADIFTFLKNAKEQYDTLSDSARITEKLNARKSALKTEIYSLSDGLSKHRREAAERFAEEVVGQLRELGMKTTFAAQFEKAPSEEEFSPNANGFDRMEFMLSANAGEPLKPMSKVASGGEMSRFMLALKNITAAIEKIPTMVFDEIDTGISGNVAQMVAKKLAQASKKEQCIVITHLPQIAAMSDAGYLIEKRELNGRTVTEVTRLDTDAKVGEISRLIGGAEIGAYGGLHAREMIDWAENFKKGLL